jgi:MerR family transcriptional regulator, heat shock protein HspR
MDDLYVTHIILRQYRSSPVYSEQEASAASHIGISTLRYLRAQGLLEGQMIDRRVRYSEEEVIQLRRIRRLKQDLGINLAGVEVIVPLLKRLDALSQELELAQNRAQSSEGREV